MKTALQVVLVNAETIEHANVSGWRLLNVHAESVDPQHDSLHHGEVVTLLHALGRLLKPGGCYMLTCSLAPP